MVEVEEYAWSGVEGVRTKKLFFSGIYKGVRGAHPYLQVPFLPSGFTNSVQATLLNEKSEIS